MLVSSKPIASLTYSNKIDNANEYTDAAAEESDNEDEEEAK